MPITQGIWFEDDGWVYADNNGNPVCVAECRSEGIPGDEQQANALLMATAPDLLAACKAAYEFVFRGGEDIDGRKAILVQLIKAINKAEGGE